MSIRLLDSTRYSMASANETNDITARTWTHIKVLYILVILLSAVALALFIVCFMMVLEVQHDVNSEISLRKERENKFLRDIVVDLPLTGQSSSQQAEIFTKETKNTESLILAGNEVKLSASVLTKFCASIHAHCPVRGFPGAQGPVGVKGEKGQIGNTGLRGFKGETGDAGLPGLGVKGDAGVKGQKGSTGLPGHDGINGLTGLKGQKGALGHKGDPGDVLQCDCLVGPPGEKGDPGVCPRPPPIHVLFQNTTIPEKKRDLTIKRIGKPVLFRRMDVNWGSWMVDSDPTVITKDKYYVTKHFTGRLVYEYSTAQFSLKSGNYSKVYNIQDHFYGTGGVVYRGSFYYNRAGLDIIARYDFNAKSITAQLPIQDSLHRGAENLFSTDYNVFDLAVDQNGLWVVYAFKDSVVEEAVSDLLLIAKLEPNYLDIEKAWNLTVNRKEYSNSFIAHGILYLLDSATEKNTQFSFIYDLYKQTPIDFSLPFTNVFNNNQMLSYDFLAQNILAWDAGRAIAYPIVAN